LKGRVEMEKAYGGVVINEQEQILLREPSGHFDGYVWTFPKGRPDPGESVEETALREVLEETGVRCKIVAKIPGKFVGSTTSNEYFLMALVEDTKQFKEETQAVHWASEEEAETFIVQTKNPAGKQRDLKLLRAALSIFKEQKNQL
jgi:8-oxo-dGTP diphosphatase